MVATLARVLSMLRGGSHSPSCTDLQEGEWGREMVGNGRRGEGKVIVHKPSLWGRSPHDPSQSSSTAKGRKALELWKMALFGLRQSRREEPCGGWEGDIDETRMEPVQPKRAGFSLMDCLPSLLPWGQ